MIYDITIDDGSGTSVTISLTYRAWIPGRDPWVFTGGSGVPGVTNATDWAITKAQAVVDVFANLDSGATEQEVFQLTGFADQGGDPVIGDTGVGTYVGPGGSFGVADASHPINWTINNIR